MQRKGHNMSNRLSWDEYFMIIAKVVSIRSTCNSRHIGVVVVKDKHILATGYNGAMPGYEHCTDKTMSDGGVYCERRAQNVVDLDKYNFCIASHAESNAISQAANKGISLNGGVIYTTLFPCFNCFKMVVMSGIKKIIYEYEYESKNKKRDSFWEQQVKNTGIACEKLIIKSNTIEIVNGLLRTKSSNRLLEATN